MPSGFYPSDIQPGMVAHGFLGQVARLPILFQPAHDLSDKKVIPPLPFYSANYRIYTPTYNDK